MSQVRISGSLTLSQGPVVRPRLGGVQPPTSGDGDKITLTVSKNSLALLLDLIDEPGDAQVNVAISVD